MTIPATREPSNVITATAQADKPAARPARRSRSIQRALRLILAILVVGTLLHFYREGQLTQENLKQLGAALPGWLFFPAYLTLPLAGFPISVVLLASGLKYGFGMSVAIAAVGMAWHTFCAWHIAHGYFRQPLEGWLRRTRFNLPTIPERHQIWFTSLFVTVPGLPYAAKLYSLALTNLPFQRYMLIVWFFHLLNSVLFIGIGAAAGSVDPKLMVGLGVLGVVMIAISNLLKRRLESNSRR